MMKKTAALLLTMILCLGACCAQALTMTGLETEYVERSWSESKFFARMEALTGVSVQARGVSDEKDIEKVFRLLTEKEVTLDAIVNIAGIFAIDSFIEVENDLLRRIFDVNTLGTMYVNKIMYPLLKKDGRIVITTSEDAPLDPMPYNGIYNVSKTALDSYSQSLRQELNLLGQKVITVRPGAFNTSLAQGSLVKTKELTEKTVLYKKQSANFYQLVKMFMGKPRDPERIAPTYYKAVTKKHPRIIYSKHLNILLILMSLLPKRAQCFIVKLLLKL